GGDWGGTMIPPFIFPWPRPQNFAHLNRNVPALSGVSVIWAGLSLLNTTFSSVSSLQAKPCFVSSLSKVISTGSPTFNSMWFGWNSYFFATTVILRGSWAAAMSGHASSASAATSDDDSKSSTRAATRGAREDPSLDRYISNLPQRRSHSTDPPSNGSIFNKCA